jgi:hypothetical protein
MLVHIWHERNQYYFIILVDYFREKLVPRGLLANIIQIIKILKNKNLERSKF